LKTEDFIHLDGFHLVVVLGENLDSDDYQGKKFEVVMSKKI